MHLTLFNSNINRKQFILYALPLLVLSRFVLQNMIYFIADYALHRHPFMIALWEKRSTACYDSPWLPLEYSIYLIIGIVLYVLLVYSTAYVIIGRLRNMKIPLLFVLPMLAVDIFIFPYIWVPLCLLNKKSKY